jgi:putative intracellular protease/amidase
VPRIRPLILLLALGLLAAPFTISGTAAAEIAPPWCGTPEPDAAGSLPDGSSPAHPLGSFPHIPYYAIGCTLADIADRSDGRMTVEVAGQSATGRNMYEVVINALETSQQRKDYRNWRDIHEDALDDPKYAQRQIGSLLKYDRDFKIPIFIQGGIHGNEFEGVDASMQLIERLALTPYGTDPEVDRILDHLIIIFNPIQNPDGRVAGIRQNGNIFDLNRDFLTQSQSETKASVSIMKRWFAPDMLDLHGYVTPTLVEATTKPHNPSIEYDLWLKWNQSRIDANEAAMNAIGQQIQRPINDWCPEADLPNASTGLCDDGSTAGPAVAEGWDDWGPFYTPMYSQHLGLNGSTVEMCSGTSCGGRAGSRRAQYVVSWSTLLYDAENRHDLYSDMITIYQRGDTDAPRPPCCPAPFDVANNWMLDYPQAYVIPRGAGQRSNAEANRLVEWLLFNDAEVHEITSDYNYLGKTYTRDSYVVFMAQPRRGLIDTALSIGVDVSSQISRLYAPPGAWSHGYLWGADVLTIPDGPAFRPWKHTINKPDKLAGGIESGAAGAYALEIDSPTAVRTLNGLLAGGLDAQLALAPFPAAGGGTLPAGTAVFSVADADALDEAGDDNGLTFRRVNAASLPALEALDRVPRIAVLTGTINQDVWVLRNLGFSVDPVSTAVINAAPADPLANYDVVFNTGGWPSAALPTARARLTAFFAAGGGYIGAGTNGAVFLTSAGEVTGLAAANRGGDGRSGIVYWNNTAGPSSPVTGVYPEQDTAIMDPPTWFTSVPATMSVDGRLPFANFLASGLWSPDAASASAPGAAVIAHGTNATSTSRMTVFAMNPLYRADPEREWPMISSAAYWADQ